MAVNMDIISSLISYYYHDLLLALVVPVPLLLFYYYLIKSSATANDADAALGLPPGPWRLPIVGNLHQLLLRGALLHRVLRDLSLRHGPVMLLRAGEVPVVVVSSRDAAAAVLRTHDAAFATRPQTPTVRVLSDGSPGLLLAPYGPHWRASRRICAAELLCAPRVLSFRPVREHEAARLVGSVVEAKAKAEAVNVSEAVVRYVTDVTVRCVMGDRLLSDRREAFLREVERDVRILGGFSVADLFPSSRLVRALRPFLFREAVAHRDAVVEIMDQVFEDHMDRRRTMLLSESESESEEDLIDVLVRLQKEDAAATGLSPGATKGLDLFSAGSETAAVTLQWAMAELMRNPGAMTRAQDEVRAVFAGKTKVTEEGGLIKELSYLRWVIKETLRLHPPGTLLLPRECRERCRVLGYDVPKGAMVMVNAWAISRDPGYWEEPEVFRPDRFQGLNRDFRGNDFEFTPFGAGRRICPGISFAQANIELALASLLFHFDWSLPDGVSGECTDLDMTEEMGLTTRRKADLWLKATPHVPVASP